MSKKTQFMVDFTGMIDEAKDNAEEVVRLASLQIFTKIVDKTPVDTGHLAYNWHLTVNTPELSERDGVDPNKSKTIDIGTKNIASYKLGVQQVWITNNVEYAKDIEYGKSKLKNPQGMVRVTMREWDSIFKGASMKVNKGTGSKQNRYK